MIAYENESILRTFGASGMSINSEFEKKEIRLLASKLEGTSMADSFVVSSKWSRLIFPKQIENKSLKFFKNQTLSRIVH